MSVKDDWKRIAENYTSSGGKRESRPGQELPRLPSFEAYTERRLNEFDEVPRTTAADGDETQSEMPPEQAAPEEPAGEPELDMMNHSLSNQYARYMPRIMAMIRTARDAQQLMAKLQADLKNHPAMTASGMKRMDRTRGMDFARMSQMRQS